MTENEQTIANLKKLKSFHNGSFGADIDRAIKAMEQEPTEKCKWIKYDYRTMCPKEHIDVDNPYTYWRIPKNRMKVLKYCPYCGKEIEVEE